MNLRFWTSSGPRQLTAGLRNELGSLFDVGPESLDKLRFMGKNGKYAGRSVEFIRVFDPAFLSTGGATSLKYEHLHGVSDRRLLRFEGHIEKDGRMHLIDRRLGEADGGTEDTN